MPARVEEAAFQKLESTEIEGAGVLRFRRNAPEGPLEESPGPVSDLLKEESCSPIFELAVRLHESAGAIERAIRRLRESGRLERVGPAKGGSWRVLE